MTTIAVQPIKLDLKLYAGDGFSMLITFVDKTTGEAWPTAGSWTAQVRAPAESNTTIVDFIVNTDEDAGTVSVSLTGVQTRSLLGVKSAAWDLQQQITGSEPRTWYRGSVSATQDVTRP